MIKNKGRYLKGAAFGSLGFCTSWAVNVRGDGPEWVEVVEVKLELVNLPAQFRGKRIAHVSDLHCSSTVSSKYLKHCIERINFLNVDIVVLTGDYVTHDYRGRYRKKVTNLLRSIRSRLGIYACLGNHDYGIGGLFGIRQDNALREMILGMEDGGLKVLRNDSCLLETGGQRLRLVGLGDLWADDFDPARAFADVGADEVVIALAHNPDSIELLHKFDFGAAMCGHTHGSRFHFTVVPGEAVINRRFYYAGMYKIGSKKLYVNRGLGRLGKAFSTRPEITVFRLC